MKLLNMVQDSIDTNGFGRCGGSVITGVKDAMNDDSKPSKAPRKRKTMKMLTEDEKKPIKVLAARMKEAREMVGMSQIDVAARIGVSRQSVSQWESGEDPPKFISIVRYAEVLGIDVADLTSSVHNSLSITDRTKQRLATDTRAVPLYGTTVAGEYIMGAVAQPKAHRYVSAYSDVKPTTIAVEVSGNANSPMYREGDYVVLEQDEQPVPEDMIFACVDGEFVFRQYFPAKAGTHVGARLAAINTSWPDMEMAEEDRILGVVVEHTRLRRQ